MRKELSRLSILIDGGHYNAIQRYYQTNFDFLRFMEEARKLLAQEIGPFRIAHTFYYDCEPYSGVDATPEEREALSKRRAYFNFLRTQLVRVREGALIKRETSGEPPVFQQKRTDLLLGLDIAEECMKGLVSHIALVAGDADLIPAVEFASHRGVQVWLLHGPRDMCSDALWAAADERVEVDIELIRKIAK